MAASCPDSKPKIGVLALQGAFREHLAVLRRLGVGDCEVRLPAHLDDIDALIIPGGESTTMGKLMVEYGLLEPLRGFVSKKPVMGTCAGLVLLSAATTGSVQPLLGGLDITVSRNAFGRQIHSFEAPVDVDLDQNRDQSFPGVFIRAPLVVSAAENVRVFATFEGQPVGVQQGHLLGVAFHPELTTDTRIHEYFLRLVAAPHASR